MKNLAIFTLLFLSFNLLNAQTSTDEIEYLQAIFGMEKRAAVKEFISLETSESQAFWKNYDEYEEIRKAYGKQRIELLDKFAERYDIMSDQESIEWMKSVISLRDKNEKLIAKYYKRLLKECSPSVAMQFYQIESYVLAGIRFQILENMPF